MNAINNFLVKTDCFCEYIPLVSSITNLVDLFQKCVVLPFINKTTISSNHYYKHINEKSFLRCFLLVIPVIGNIIVGIHDFAKKNEADVLNDQIKNLKKVIGIVKTNTCHVSFDNTCHISLDDVKEIHVNGDCQESYPCKHKAVVILKDGNNADSSLNGSDLYLLVSGISEDKIYPGLGWNVGDIKAHFDLYSTPPHILGWKPKSAEEVLKNLFPKIKQ